MSATIVSQMPRNPCHSEATTHICFLSSSSVLQQTVKDTGREQVHQALLARLAGCLQAWRTDWSRAQAGLSASYYSGPVG